MRPLRPLRTVELDEYEPAKSWHSFFQQHPHKAAPESEKRRILSNRAPRRMAERDSPVASDRSDLSDQSDSDASGNAESKKCSCDPDCEAPCPPVPARDLTARLVPESDPEPFVKSDAKRAKKCLNSVAQCEHWRVRGCAGPGASVRAALTRRDLTGARFERTVSKFAAALRKGQTVDLALDQVVVASLYRDLAGQAARRLGV